MSKSSSDRSGRRAEAIAAWYLRLKGYQILARRHVTPVGEIDLIAWQHTLLIFVEVKFRAQEATALGSISVRQQQRINRAAAAYLKFHPEFGELDIRFDVVAFGGWHWPVHVEDAWRPEPF